MGPPKCSAGLCPGLWGLPAFSAGRARHLSKAVPFEKRNPKECPAIQKPAAPAGQTIVNHLERESPWPTGSCREFACRIRRFCVCGFRVTFAATNYANALTGSNSSCPSPDSLPRTSVLLRVFPVVTFPPHLRCNSPRLNDLAIRSNKYLISKRFLLTTTPIRATIPHGIGAPATFRPPHHLLQKRRNSNSNYL